MRRAYIRSVKRSMEIIYVTTSVTLRPKRKSDLYNLKK